MAPPPISATSAPNHAALALPARQVTPSDRPASAPRTIPMRQLDRSVRRRHQCRRRHCRHCCECGPSPAHHPARQLFAAPFSQPPMPPALQGSRARTGCWHVPHCVRLLAVMTCGGVLPIRNFYTRTRTRTPLFAEAMNTHTFFAEQHLTTKAEEHELERDKKTPPRRRGAPGGRTCT